MGEAAHLASRSGAARAARPLGSCNRDKADVIESERAGSPVLSVLLRRVATIVGAGGSNVAQGWPPPICNSPPSTLPAMHTRLASPLGRSFSTALCLQTIDLELLAGYAQLREAFLEEVAKQRFAEKVAGNAIVVLLVRLRAQIVPILQRGVTAA